MQATKKYGGWAEAAICLYRRARCTVMEYFANLAQELQNMGADSICIKDMANLLSAL